MDGVQDVPPITCALYSSCRNALGSATPRMSWKARARGMWRGPAPAVVQNLTVAERCVIQPARSHIRFHRVESWIDRKLPYTADVHPYEHSGNMVAYPLESHALAQTLCVTSERLPAWIQVVLEGDNTEVLRHDQSLRVNVAHLRAAFAWLLFICWPWPEAT